MRKSLDVWELRAMLRTACNAAGGQNKWAETANVSAQYVSDVLNERREPGEAICRALGLARVIRYVPDAWESEKDLENGEENQESRPGPGNLHYDGT